MGPSTLSELTSLSKCSLQAVLRCLGYFTSTAAITEPGFNWPW